MKKGTPSSFLQCVIFSLLTVLPIVLLPFGGSPQRPRGKAVAAEIRESQIVSEQFTQKCAACHPDGGNAFKPHLPLTKAPQLQDFDAFLAYIRNPKARDGAGNIMPPYPAENLSDEQARRIYQQIIDLQKKN
jgi:mono/diheme cytochrome c family protein